MAQRGSCKGAVALPKPPQHRQTRFETGGSHIAAQLPWLHPTTVARVFADRPSSQDIDEPLRPRQYAAPLRLTPNGVAHVFGRAVERAGITTGDVTLHTLRHRALSRMIAGGYDDYTVMSISGTRRRECWRGRQTAA